MNYIYYACWKLTVFGKKQIRVVIPNSWTEDSTCTDVHVHDGTTLVILGDPGAVSQVGRKGATKVFKYGQKSPWVPTLTELFPKIQTHAGSWLGTKNALYYCAQSAFLLSSFREFVHDGHCFNHGLSGSCTKDMHAVRILSVWYKIPIFFKKPSLSLQQVFMLASVTSCVNIREFLKDTTMADNHKNVAWKREFTFFQFLSWLFQLAYFVKMQEHSSRA